MTKLIRYHTNRISILSSTESVDANDDDESDTNNSVANSSRYILWLPLLVVMIGGVAAGIFLGFGIAGANKSNGADFDHLAEELSMQIMATYEDFETTSTWLHLACISGLTSRDSLQSMYSHIVKGIDIQSISWAPLVLDQDRLEFESSNQTFFRERYPEFDYLGITEMEETPFSPGFSLVPRATADVYYPVRILEPLETELSLVDFDLLSCEVSRDAVNEALRTNTTAVSKPFKRFPGSTNLSDQNSVLIVNAQSPEEGNIETADLGGASMVVLEMEAFIARTLSRINYDTSSVYLYDSSGKNDVPLFLIGVNLKKEPEEYFLPEIEMDDLFKKATSLVSREDMVVGSGQWTLIVVANYGEYTGGLLPVVIAGIFIFAASCFLAFWIWSIMRKSRKMQSLRLQADAEKAAAVLMVARQHAQAEEELNDYIAHEIRNPLAAAMSACSFVKTTINKKSPLRNDEKVTIQEDVEIIDSSLGFMNDLLRSMLDMHKAASKKIELTLVPVDIKRDILQPVAGMLYRRNSSFDVVVDCPENLFVKTDRLRLKQIILNLGRNSAKFVDSGYIRLGAGVDRDSVNLYVEDSGPGIPTDKKEQLFNKFQESLDVLEQGTGMGLCLCKNMAVLLGGDIWLDETFESGVQGRPGSRFVVDLKVPVMPNDEYEALLESATVSPSRTLRLGMDGILEECSRTQLIASDEQLPSELPLTLSVLFVDDDMVLRKLFCRSVKKVSSTWNIEEAPNGETALEMAQSQHFDIIFVDQYMASVDKTMLGTETVHAMRSVGIQSRICGLSANDVEEGFLVNGADFFLQKPLPCKPLELKQELLRVIYAPRPSGSKFQADNRSSCSLSTTLEDSGDFDASSKGRQGQK